MLLWITFLLSWIVFCGSGMFFVVLVHFALIFRMCFVIYESVSLMLFCDSGSFDSEILTGFCDYGSFGSQIVGCFLWLWQSAQYIFCDYVSRRAEILNV